MIRMALLPHRGVLEIHGEDKTTFLQGLVTNDINAVTPENAIYAALLSPQGRFLYDFFIMQKGDSYYLDVELERLPDLVKKLSLYKLRSRVVLTPRPDLKVFALWGENIRQALGLKEERGSSNQDFFVDPRLVELGVRLMSDTVPEEFQEATLKDYHLHRLMLGIPEGGTDLIPEKSILLESNLDELNAISWAKGCYIGQELTTRTKFQGLVRKRLFPVKIEGDAPAFGEEIYLNGSPIGTMRTHAGSYGLAMLRLENLNINGKDERALECGQAILTPYKPFWMKIESL